MLIGFLGAPISGKTTTAAQLFASLKDLGYVAEFLPEQARAHIAFERYDAKRKGDPEPQLDDTDQLDILRAQNLHEKVFAAVAAPASFIVTDCAAFLALLYMTPEARADEKVLAKARASAERFDLLFRCYPVRPGHGFDPNRKHSFEQSQELDTQLDAILDLVGIDRTKVVDLAGPSQMRASMALTEVLERAATCLR